MENKQKAAEVAQTIIPEELEFEASSEGETAGKTKKKDTHENETNCTHSD